MSSDNLDTGDDSQNITLVTPNTKKQRKFFTQSDIEMEILINFSHLFLCPHSTPGGQWVWPVGGGTSLVFLTSLDWL